MNRVNEVTKLLFLVSSCCLARTLDSFMPLCSFGCLLFIQMEV